MKSKLTITLIFIVAILSVLAIVFTVPASAGYSEFDLLSDRNFQNLEAKVDALQILVAGLDPTKLESRVAALEEANAAQAQALAEVKAENAAMVDAIEAMRAEIEAMMNAPETEEEVEKTYTLYTKLAVAFIIVVTGILSLAICSKKYG